MGGAEIGSSDVSAMVSQVMSHLGVKEDAVSEEEMDEAGINAGGRIGAGALALGLGATAAGMIDDGRPIPYMYKPDPKGGFEIVLKRNPSNQVGHADSEDEAKAKIRDMIAQHLKDRKSTRLNSSH